MRRYVIAKNTGVWANVFVTLAVCGGLLFMSGCRNMLDPETGPQGAAGKGTLLLAIGDQGATARTILPEVSLSDFDAIRLDFSAECYANSDFYMYWTDADDMYTGAVELDAGTWDLRVTAFMGGGLRAASGERVGIVLVSGQTVQYSVGLSFYLDEGRGTFSWDIGLPAGVATAEMNVTRIDGIGEPFSQPFPLIAGRNLGDVGLDSGQYEVVFTLHYRGETTVLSTILHVYKNLESRFYKTFTYIDFPLALLDFVLASWNGDAWVFAERGITAAHFSHLGILGVDNGNFGDIVGWFNDPRLVVFVPDSLEGLKVLVDAALIGVGSEDAAFLLVSNYPHRDYADDAIIGLARNYTEVTLDWIDGDTVIAEIRMGGSVVYEVEIVFSDAVPIADADGNILVPGDGLAARLAWLRDNAHSGQRYLVEISDDETLAPDAGAGQTLPAGRTNLTVVLRGVGGDHSIDLSANGPLFIVDSGVTLVLENISLQGRSGNTNHLVRINGGALVMNAGSSVTGNTNTSGTTAAAGGAVLVNLGGTFTMNYGVISDNTTAWGGAVRVAQGTFVMNDGEISGNATTGASDGGGVFVGSNGRFYMRGGSIFDNSSARNGGGVHNEGAFRMSNGIIHGNEAAAGLGNTASSSGASLSHMMGTAWHGTYHNGAFTQTGTLSTTNLTIQVVDGKTALAGTVVITGNVRDGQTLTANTSGLSHIGTLSFQWMRGTTEVGTDSNTYLVHPDDANQYITVTVTSSGNHGYVTSAPVGPVVLVLSGTVGIIGTPNVGQELTVDTSYLGGSGAFSFRWMRGATEVGVDDTYIVQDEDEGLTITVQVSRADNYGHVSASVAIRHREDFTISFADFLEIGTEMTGPTVRVFGTAAETSRSVSVLEPGQYDEDSIRWLIGRTPITGAAVTGTYGETLTFGPSIHNNMLGTHFVTVEVEKDGVPFSKIIVFTVAP